MKREVQEIKESETLHTDEAAVSRLVAGLEHVEAPANFERRVMAKIADGQQPSRRMFGLPIAVAYSLPLLLVLVVVAGYFVNFGGSMQSPPVTNEADVFPQGKPIDRLPPVNENTISPSDSTTIASGGTENPKNPVVLPAPKAGASPQPKKNKEPGGGSFVSTVLDRKPVPIPGVGNNNRIVSPVTPDGLISSSPLPVREVLSFIGITADFKDGWVVRSIAPNNKAERSGVKIGDVIISLGNTPLFADTIYKGKVEAGSIRVRRNGQELDLLLK